MTKVLLVEDDNNLREIYEARLAAEGYDIVTAKDGEDALATAKQHKPELIISDVMMPRISGFEMLDILRNTEGLKNVKIIMLTALGQAEDKDRADHLGADRYLVKSQVTLEDIVKAAQDLINGNAAPTNTTSSTSTSADTAINTLEGSDTTSPTVQAETQDSTPIEVVTSSAEVTPAPPETVVQQDMPTMPLPPAEPVNSSPQIPIITPSTNQQDTSGTTTGIPQVQPEPPQPPVEPQQTQTTDTSLQENSTEPTVATAQSENQEEAEVEKQIEQFVNSNPVTTETVAQVAVEPASEEVESAETTEQDNASIINAAAEQLSTKVVPEDSTKSADITVAQEGTMPEAYDEESSGSTQIPGKKVIQPLNEDLNKADLATLLAQEESKANAEKEATNAAAVTDATVPTNSVQAQVVSPPLSINSSEQTSSSVFKPHSDGDDSFNAL